MNDTEVKDWTCDDVQHWLCDLKFEKYVTLFCKEHSIDGETLLVLTENDLRQPPLEMRVLSDIKRLSVALRRLQQNNNHLTRSFESQEHDDVRRSPVDYDSVMDEDSQLSGAYTSGEYVARRMSGHIVKANGHVEYYNPTNQAIGDSYDLMDNCKIGDAKSCSLPPEPWKTLLSFVYVSVVFGITAFVMVIVHDRVPDMDKYPPLPDLFLDNMPYVPWAFECCELIAVVLSTVWIAILCFHKHRFILLRRFFSLTGTVFMLRSISMLITSMSVPGIHLSCQGQSNSDPWSKLHRAMMIWKGFGMTLQGVRSCGDYMFSGHTVIITMLNFFITEYTPQIHMYYLHTLSWVLNLFGIFFILAAHEHYSIDVFIAFYITSRLFLYYHTLANNRVYIVDVKRTKVWFPLFSFFESKCNGAVPNEYEWPLPWPRSVRSYFGNEKRKPK